MQGQPDLARADLDEAWQIAERGHNAAAPGRHPPHAKAELRMSNAEEDREKLYPWKSPQADLAAVEKLINDCGYHRRDPELADAWQAILGSQQPRSRGSFSPSGSGDRRLPSPLKPCRERRWCVIFRAVSTLAEIESAVEALPLPQQEKLFQHLAERFNGRVGTKRRLPLVPATGRPITQEEIDDALDAD